MRRRWAVELGELGKGGSSLKTPRRLTFGDQDSLFSGWTRDSKAVFFSSNRNGKSEIFKQGLNEAIPETVISGSARAWGASQTPDGTWILYAEQDRASAKPGAPTLPVRVMRLPAAGGSPQMVFESPGPLDLNCPLKPGCSCALLQMDGDVKVIYWLDPVRGKGSTIGRIAIKGSSFDWGLSPDGPAWL